MWRVPSARRKHASAERYVLPWHETSLPEGENVLPDAEKFLPANENVLPASENVLPPGVRTSFIRPDMLDGWKENVRHNGAGLSPCSQRLGRATAAAIALGERSF